MFRFLCWTLSLSLSTAISQSDGVRKAKHLHHAKATTAMDIISKSLKAHAELNRFRAGTGAAGPFQVNPKQKTGRAMKPMPDMPDPTVRVRSPEDYLSDNSTVKFSKESQLTDLHALKDAIDSAEERIKGLKLYVVEKENFLDSLRKRERMLDSDINLDKEAIQNLLEHIDALDARMNRLKKEDQLKELSGLYANYSTSAQQLESEADGFSSARDALQQRISMLQGTVQDLKAKEALNSQMALDGGEDTLQTYGYAGTISGRQEALQSDINSQMAQMIHQQNVLQQQLALLGGGNATAQASGVPPPKTAAKKPAKPATKKKA